MIEIAKCLLTPHQQQEETLQGVGDCGEGRETAMSMCVCHCHNTTVETEKSKLLCFEKFLKCVSSKDARRECPIVHY